MLVLPWHFRTEIIEREKAFLDAGGQLIFPFPTFEVYSNRPKTLITGITGQIGKYVSEYLRTTDAVYGITRSLATSYDGPLLIQADICSNELEDTILLIKPDRIIHLASMTNTEECEQNSLAALDLNGRCILNICDVVYRNGLKCKVFNASSSELFKGNGEHHIEDTDTNFKPATTYGFCKLLGHQVVDSYRVKYGVPFSNGIIFMTESKYRPESFLLKKVTLHARRWPNDKSVLDLGNLDSYRNINHASDIAEGIKYILAQDAGDTYVMCGSDFLKVEDIVLKIYEIAGIHLVRSANGFVEKTTGFKVLNVGSAFRGSVSKINGSATKLRALGWSPKYSLQTLLEDISEIS
jgi:GDPmannose 4,6-dehydratase